jgi:hypothetical protein
MVNMTAQRELLFRIGGPERSTRVLNTELTGMASAMMLGPLVGGVTIAAFGLGVAFAIPTVLLAVSAPLLWISTRGLTVEKSGGAPDVRDKSYWRLLRRSRALAVILLVTVICNLCYFAFLPLVPVIARYLNAGAVMAGVLGAAAGVVQLVITAGLAVRPLRRPLVAYTFGVALCLCCLAVLAYTPVVSVALLALGVAGIGQALFGSTQATLPVAAVAPHERAAALGLLATTIGVALPTGMVVLGVMSSLLGAQLAMLVSALVGLVALAVTLLVSARAIGVGGERDSVAAQAELGQRARLAVLVGDDVLEPDQGSADVDADKFGRLFVGGDGANSGLTAPDANSELSLEDQDDVGLVDVEVRRIILAERDVVDRKTQRQAIFQHQALDHQDGPTDGKT